MRARHAVHYVSTATTPQGRVVIAGDAGAASGTQRITFTRNHRTGHVTVVVAGDAAYIRGDAFTLVDFMGFAAGPARKYAGRWIGIPRASREYAPVAAGVTYASVVAQLAIVGPYRVGRATTISGVRAVAVRAHAPPSQGVSAVVTLYLRSPGALPVEEVGTDGRTRLIVVLGRWNESVSVRAPRGAVPIHKVESKPA